MEMPVNLRLVAAAFFLLLLLCGATIGRRKDRTRARLRYRDVSPPKEGTCELEVSCRSTGDVPVRLPIRGPRGPPGAPGEKGEIGEPGTPGLPGIPGKSTIPPARVAFFAGLKENVGPVAKNTDIAFEKVVTNVGGAYDSKSGRFTAPLNGTYHFTVVVAAQGSQRGAVMIVKNGSMVETVWAESIPLWASASNSAILEMKRGDQVWLIQLSRAPYLHGYMYSSFSGFIVFPDE